MCGLCAAHNSFNPHCDTSSESINHHGHNHPSFREAQNNRIDEILPSDVEIAYNSQNKADFNLDQAAAQITRGNTKWNDGVGGNQLGTAGTVTYSFSANPGSGNSVVSAQQIAVTEQAIAAIEAVANISFTRVGPGLSDSADINVESTPGGGGYASWGYYGGFGSNLNEFNGATVALGSTAGYTEDTSYGMTVALHEVAHAIGLSHPGAYNGSGATNYTDQAEYFQDSRQFSVMSYWSESNTGADFYARAWTGSSYEWVGGFSTNLMLHDIAALQRLYGANTTTRTGDTVYGFNSNTGDSTWTLDSAADSIIAAVWDAGGIDTVDLSGFYEDADVDLREEAFSSFGGLKWNFSIAKGAIIENATGGFGNDKILGNSAANTLLGMQGNDTLNGAAGNDWLDGGAGSDELQGGAGNDTVVYDPEDNLSNVNGGSGFDTLLFDAIRLSIDLLSYGFEQSALRLLDAASELWSEIIEYYNLNDELTERHTEFDNGTSEIRVFDTQGVESWSEWIRQFGANGNLISETYVPDNTDFYGDASDNVIAGTTSDDKIYGLGGNDSLTGGLGADEIDGGTGDFDTVFYDQSLEGVILTLDGAAGVGGEAEGDTITNVEQVVGSLFNDFITGNDSNNVLFGHAGNDTLIGGAGSDFLLGGAGADHLDGGVGILDTVDYRSSKAGVTVNLDAGTGIGGDAEGDTLVNVDQILGSSLYDNLIGNDADNILFGFSGDDVLDGGIGNDFLVSGIGADTLNGGQGSDTANYLSSAAGVSINLQTGAVSGGEAEGDALNSIENIIGSNAADTLLGSSDNNLLFGFGGDDVFNFTDGIDTINGGGDTDTVIFSGNQADFNFIDRSDLGAGVVFVDDDAGNVSALFDIERVQFNDTGMQNLSDLVA